MRRALFAVLLAACDGQVIGGPGSGGSGGARNLPPAIVEPPPQWRDSATQEVSPPAERFSTVTWDLEADAQVPALAALDVRALPNGEVELLNPRFALKASATHQLAFSKVRVVVGATESAAFEQAYVVAASARAAVMAPGLIAFERGAAPLTLRLRFVAKETADAPVPATTEPMQPPPPPELVEGQTYVLHTTCTDGTSVVAIEGGATTDEAPVVLAAARAGAPEQRFTMMGTSQGGVMIVARHSGRALNVPRGSLAEGTQLIQWDAGDVMHPNQRWAAQRESDGSYRFAGLQSGLFIDAVGSAVVQAAPGASCAQRFVLEHVE